MIDSFKCEYHFLSNFYGCEIHYDGFLYKSVEAAYQASKSMDYMTRASFENFSPFEAKKKGRKLILRPQFDSIKYDIMLNLVQIKFLNNELLANKLLETGDEELIEGNTWNDVFWGVCNGEGKNNLGKILMHTRNILLTLRN